MRAGAKSWILLWISLSASASAAPPGPVDESDRYELAVHGETHVELFRRALLPGPRGSLIESDTVVPVHQYLRLDARNLDTGWQKDAVDVELGAFGRAWFGERENERTFDGDVQTAFVRYRHGPVSLRLGRQHVAGGAARYARFDGADVAVELGAGLDVEAYGGFTVLPRWNARPGYHHLGDAADTLLVDPDALPEAERSGHLLGGGRIGYGSDRIRAGLSFHEQHEPDGLARRGLGADARAHVSDRASVGANALVELDARRLQDARLFADLTPIDRLDLSAELLHTEPALFLSRQSVLSVFSTDAYDEAAGSALVRVTDRFSVEGEGAVQIYDESRRGARSELGVRVLPGAGKRTLVRLSYARVLAVDNGYHSLRASLARRITAELTGTLEAYSYLYDEPISGHTTSEVYAGTLAYRVSPPFRLLLGTSVARSPYAALDAQALVSASYAFDFSTRGEP
jgi:hypothetical protein